MIGLEYVEGFLAEDDVLIGARVASADRGLVAVGAGAGAGLRFLAATIGAKAVVEIGTGAGVSGLWLLRGMVPDGVLTSIDVDPEHQRAARTAFTAAGHGPSRLRLINGMGLDVLPRLCETQPFCAGEARMRQFGGETHCGFADVPQFGRGGEGCE